jgi:hypothetical protein
MEGEALLIAVTLIGVGLLVWALVALMMKDDKDDKED